MPNLTSLKLPDLNETDFNSKESIRQLRDYMFKLQEQLSYILAHLDEDNLSQDLAAKIENSGGGESSGVLAIVEDEMSGLKTQIEQNAHDITLTATQNDLTTVESKISLVVDRVDDNNVIKIASIVAAINNAGSTVAIKADHIDLSGYVTANGGFAIFDGNTRYGNDTPAAGSMKCTEGYIGNIRITPTGTIVPTGKPFAIGDMIFLDDTITGLKDARSLKLWWDQLCLDTHGRWDIVNERGTHVRADLGDGDGEQYLYAKPSNLNYNT